MYVSGKYYTLFDALEHRDMGFHEELTYWRNTTAGLYAMEIYAKYRWPSWKLDLSGQIQGIFI